MHCTLYNTIAHCTRFNNLCPFSICQEIQVDFEGRNPVDSDFHGIRQLLKQLLLKASVNLSELSDEIIGQNYIGSVVTQCEDDGADANADDDDEDDAMEEANTVFGITTALNLTQKADLGCVQALRKHLLERAERHAAGAALDTVRSVLGSAAEKTVGFLLNERFVNIPPQISVPLLENLATEVTKAAAKGMPYKFDYYVMLVKLYRAPAKPATGKKQGKKAQASDEFYTNAEEEVFVEQALCSFEYSVKGEATDDDEASAEGGASVSMASAAAAAADDDSGLVPWRKLVIFEASKLPAIIDAIKTLIET